MKYFRRSILYGRLINHKFFNQFSGSTSQYFGKNSKENDKNQRGNSWANKVLIGTTLTALATYKILDYRKNVASAAQADWGSPKENLPNYSLAEISKHTTKDNRVWTTYKEAVYDITDYIYKHPGADQIYLAAGGTLEPYFMVFPFHKKDRTFETLEQYRIGNVATNDYQKIKRDYPDPYANEPKRSPQMIAASPNPLCGGSTPYLLVQNNLTPPEIFFVRNHLPVPQLDPNTHKVEIEVAGGKTISLSMDEIKKMPKTTITCALMCSGNNRAEMRKDRYFPGVEWSFNGIGNATFTGPRLKDVLKGVGIEDDDKLKNITFEGYDVEPNGRAYGVTLPLWKALDEKKDILLAYEMNGKPLLPDHGFPIRVVVPGHAGARSCKWLAKILVSNTTSESHYMTHDYKGFSPSTDFENVDHAKSPPIMELPVYSACCIPDSNQCVKLVNGNLIAKGYAYSGGGQKIIRVDVTADGGDSWVVADIDYQEKEDSPRHWGWTLWTAKIPIKPGTKKVEIWSKAVNSFYNVQPESFQNIWNFRGCACNAYHRVRVAIK